TNWYQSIVLDKGARDGINVEMGVMAPDGAVGRVVKVTPFTSMVLLITDPNNAVTGLIQRTRDEGIVEGTADGRARMKYIPLLATLQSGDVVVTSGLTGGFPRGIPMGTITRIDKAEGELFQSAEIVPEVDLHKLEEVLVITDPLPVGDEREGAGGRSGSAPAEARP
ncbi:MAG: rod shape-determining protein MreC, partial [Nitrospirota bacterium]|nr:rod shape-determining protein MreC [Nitrospirota bacterium]